MILLSKKFNVLQLSIFFSVLNVTLLLGTAGNNSLDG